MFRLPKQFRDTEILWRRLILFTAALILIIVYFQQILHFVEYLLAICTPFFLGGAFAFILTCISNSVLEIYKRFIHEPAGKPAGFICDIAALIIALSIIILFMFLILPHAIDSFQKLSVSLPYGIQNWYQMAIEASGKVPYIQSWLVNINLNLENINELISNVGSWIISGGANDLFTSLYQIISTTFSWMITLFIAIAFSVILLFNRKTAAREMNTLIKAYFPPKYVGNVMSTLALIRSTFSHYISGSCTECLILGALVTIFASLFHLPYAFLSGVVIGIGALVPMFGALAAAMCMSLFIAISSVSQAVIFMIMFLAIQNVEGNFIYPHVVGHFVELPPMYVIIAVTLGANLAGVFGMIVSIPICSIVYQLIKENALQRVNARRFKIR